MSRNAWRYVLVVLLTFLTAALASVGESGATLVLVLKHGAVACIPTLTALRMTLEQSLEKDGDVEKISFKASNQG